MSIRPSKGVSKISLYLLDRMENNNLNISLKIMI